MLLSGPLLNIRPFFFFFFFSLNILSCFAVPQVPEPLGCPGASLCDSATLTLWSCCCLAAVRAVTWACQSCCCSTSLLLLCCCSCLAPAHPEVLLCVFCQLSHAKWWPPGWESPSPFVFWFIAHHHLQNLRGNLYALNPVSTFFKKHKLNECSFTNHN